MQVALWGGALVVTAAVVTHLFRRRTGKNKRIDVGAVSDAWLAEHRGRRQE